MPPRTTTTAGPPHKRRKTEPKIEEINFDLSARQEYLTGFHKRKLQRTKLAQEAAERRAREDRIEARKKIREERKADLERHVRELDALMRPAEADEGRDGEGQVGLGEEWDGIEDVEPPPPPVDHEAEYVDEDKYTTVTVESMDATRDGLSKLADGSDQSDNGTEEHTKAKSQLGDKKVGRVKSATDKKKRVQSKLNKRKKKDFKYESKTERKVSRMKERLKNNKQAKARKAG